MKPGPRLTKEQRSELLKSYLEKGFYATQPLAIQYGIDPKHLARLARTRGHVNNVTPRPYAERKPRMKDKRWKWAAERGAVIA